MNKKYLPYILLVIIIAIAAFLRLYRIEDYMGFLGDEGRDALVVKRMIVDHKFTLLGPITSVGLMHLGPIYYYFMVPFLWAWNLHPVGPAIMVALFSLATVFLVWQLCREFLNKRAGVIAALLYAISPLVIVHSHSSWNPNILPFWGLLLIYALLKVIIQKKHAYLWVMGASLGVVIQLHYVALVFFPILLAAFVMQKVRLPITTWLKGALGFFVVYSPYILFELRHQFINTKTVWEFVTRSGDGSTFAFHLIIGKFWDLLVRLFWRLIVIENAELTIVFVLFAVVSLIWIFKTSQKAQKQVLAVFGIWLIVGIGVLSFYTGNTYDYYLMFAFPLPFILTGAVLAHFSKTKLGALGVLVVLLMLSRIHIAQTSILKPPNRIVAQTKEISDFVLQQVGQDPYNFALIAAGNSDHAYRYFLEIGGKVPVTIENEVVDPDRNTVTGQLMVVCEEKVCQPLGNSLWEIAGFGRAEIVNQWPVSVHQVFKLVPYLE
ncbi:hypothetical protein C4564_02225 [Candidatus Microgenomates bacterium]|nr:MAG: hypothetical protein C4564_02225 [Candidatus Microgenomates bacterium]